MPVRNGKTRSNRGPMVTVAPVASVSARRNARSCAVPAANIVEYRTVTNTLVLTGSTVGPETTSRAIDPGVVVLVTVDVIAF